MELNFMVKCLFALPHLMYTNAATRDHGNNQRAWLIYVIGCICLGLGSYVYGETYFVRHSEIDVIFLIIVACAIVESIIALLTAYHYKDVQYMYSFIDTIKRGIVSVAVLVVGGLLINSAYQVQDDCSAGFTCQPFEAKLAAGILCVINGVFHGIAKKNLGQACVPKAYGYQSDAQIYPGGAPQNFATGHVQQMSPGPSILSQNTSYKNQVGHHEANIQLPRFQAQNTSGYQNNQNYNQMPSNYPQRQQQ